MTQQMRTLRELLHIGLSGLYKRRTFPVQCIWVTQMGVTAQLSGLSSNPGQRVTATRNRGTTMDSACAHGLDVSQPALCTPATRDANVVSPGVGNNLNINIHRGKR